MNQPSAPRPVAIVTGAGSGIGRAVAMMLARDHALVLAGRREASLKETAGLLPGGTRVAVVPTDVSRYEDVQRLISSAVSRFDRLDVLINNAGLAPLLPIDRTTPDVIDEVFRTNALACAWAVHFAWPIFRRQYVAWSRGAPTEGSSTPVRAGCIVNVSSIASIDPFDGFFAYGAAKAAVNLMARAAAREGAPIGVRAFSVAPGAVETEMLRRVVDEVAWPRERCLAPDEVARVILECVRGERDGQNGGTIVMPNPT